MGVSFPHFPPLWRESLAGVEAAALFRSSVWRGRGVPDGEGRPVLLIPGFMAGDCSMATMTRWLRENGYQTHRAGIRANVGCSEENLARLEARLEALAETSGQRVAIIGQSPRRRLRPRARRSPAGPRQRDRHPRGADRPPAQRAPVRARPGVRGGCAGHRQGARDVPRRAACAAPAASASVPTWPGTSRPRSASPRCIRRPTASSTGARAWTPPPCRSKSAPPTSGWG